MEKKSGHDNFYFLLLMNDFVMKSIIYSFQYLLLPLCQCMDADNGDGNLLPGLPCVKRLNQLYCSNAGNSYPEGSITAFIDDNKALLRRMYGELQLPSTVTRAVTKSSVRIVTKTTIRIFRTFGQKRYF